MTIQDRLSEIEERANKATPGPWEETAGGDVCTKDDVSINEKAPEKYIKQIIEMPLSEQGRFDRKFIAASRTDIPKLVKALRVALDGIDKWANYKSGAFAEGTLTEIELILSGYSETPEGRKRILNAEGEG